MISKEERIKLYNKCLEKWGYIPQLDQGIEEMAELTIAINKVKRKRLGEFQNNPAIEDNFIEEVVDVFFCIEQFIDWIGEDKFYAKMETKIEKLKKTLNS